MSAGVSIGSPARKANVTGSVESVSRSLLRVAEDGVVEVFGIDSGAFDGAFGGDCAQFLGGEVFQFAAVAAKGRAGPADDGDVSWFEHD